MIFWRYCVRTVYVHRVFRRSYYAEEERAKEGFPVWAADGYRSGAVECVVKLENRFAIREARPRSDMRQRLPILFTEKSMWICSEGETWRLLSMRDTRISSIYSSEPVTQFLMFVTSNRKPGLALGLRLLTSNAALLVRSVVREVMEGNQEVITLVAICMALLHE